MRQDKRSRTNIAAPLLAGAVILASAACESDRSVKVPGDAPVGAGELEPFEQAVPAATTALAMRPISGGSVTIDDAGAPVTVEVAPFWMSATEIPWEVYDVFVFALDEEEGGALDVDAVSRPSRPYVPPDRGFGHAGYATISVTFKGADAFCVWLSAKTGRRYRLPTIAEWQLACERSGITPETVAEHAWYAGNSDGAPHPTASRAADASGLFDLYGNVREWCTTLAGEPVAAGGSFLDGLEEIGCAARAVQTRDWQASDPQVPKSPWWLSDAPFMGFRIVCEPGD